MKKFLLLSDIHACDADPGSASAPSYVSSAGSATSKTSDPLYLLEDLIKKENIKPDYVLCAGDITNKSDPKSFSYVWNKLNLLANSCGAELVATVGNHDLDSRYHNNKNDPRGYAMALEPKIPVKHGQKFLEYWALHFTIINSDDCNILVLNTAAYHGGGKDALDEIEHGRISDYTLDLIKREISQYNSASTNILLCHHHLIKAEVRDGNLTGLTRGGDKLIEALEDSNMPWVVVHGHKHVPDLFYGHGGSNAPVILGCASFSAQVNADAQNKNPNQVHFLISDPAAASAACLTSAGTVKSWTWQPGVGWSKSTGPHGLRHEVGFGYRGSVASLVESLQGVLASSGAAKIAWLEAVRRVPSLNHLIPKDFSAFEDALGAKGMRLLTERDGSIAEIGIKP